MKNAYNQGLECDHGDEEGGDDGVSPKDVGHNIYILAHQVPHFYLHLFCFSGYCVCLMPMLTVLCVHSDFFSACPPRFQLEKMLSPQQA